jgi:hypothetical protein
MDGSTKKPAGETGPAWVCERGNESVSLLSQIIHEITSEERASPIAANAPVRFKIDSFQQFQ